jgi:hypothetical protein
MTAHEYNVLSDLAVRLGELVGRMDEVEKARRDARAQDDHWRKRMEDKTDLMYAKLDAVPCLMDEKIAACRADRDGATGAAVQWAGTARTFVVTLVKLAAAAATVAGAIFAVGKLFGWY